jgi:hypothetical protein
MQRAWVDRLSWLCVGFGLGSAVGVAVALWLCGAWG